MKCFENRLVQDRGNSRTTKNKSDFLEKSDFLAQSIRLFLKEVVLRVV
jgi:hypothetical protein